MLARRLTSSGLELFEAFLQELRGDPQADVPRELLTDSQTSAALDVEVRAEPRRLHSRLEAAEYVSRLLKGDTAALRRDGGFWSWLALAWFDDLCPTVRNRRVPGESVRWIADLDNPRRACRHLLAGPFQIYRAHRDDPQRAMALLCGALQRSNPLVRTLAARPSLAACTAVVGAATRLYYSPATGRLRSGLNGRGPGSPRRFVDLLSQLDLTWDLQALSVEELLDLLPPEFDHFRRPAATGGAQRQRSLLD